MATLRLFASAREAAGTGSAEFDAATVEELLTAATACYGEPFGSLVRICQIWINGEPAAADDQLNATDEVAVLPPVSGG